MNKGTGWTVDGRLWEQVEEKAGRLNWRRVPFAATSAFDVPVASGIYMICASPPATSLGATAPGRPALYTALYVGKGNLRARFRRHTGRPKESIRAYTRTFSGRLDFWYASIDCASMVDATEAALIHALCPPCNDQYPRLRLRLGAAVALGRPRLAGAV